MNNDIRNLELEKLYRFGDNKYVIDHIIYKNHRSTYMMNTPVRYTFVYEFENDRVSKLIYGRIVENKELSNNQFMIVDHDSEKTEVFDITTPIKEVTGEEAKTLLTEMMLYNVNPEEYRNNKSK